MDDTRQRTLFGIAATATIIGLAFLLGRCTAPTAAANSAPTPVEYVNVAWDYNAAAAHALDDLNTWVQSTTTTTAPPRILGPAIGTPTDVETFFACVRWRESRGDYTAVNPTGTFRGAYQFYQGAWDSFAPDGWAGVDPAAAPAAVQDATAHNAYNALGARPWGGACQ